MPRVSAVRRPRLSPAAHEALRAYDQELAAKVDVDLERISTGHALHLLSPGDQARYWQDLVCFGQAGVHVDTLGRATLIKPEDVKC